MAALPISTAGVSIFVQCKGYVYFEVTGAKSITMSETANKHVVYDLSTYRDVLNAGELGRAWAEIAAEEVTPGTPFAGTIADNGLTWNDQSALSGSFLAPENLDDRIAKTPPHEWAKPDTVIVWWDGALGTGNAIAQCRYAQFISYSNTRPLLMF